MKTINKIFVIFIFVIVNFYNLLATIEDYGIKKYYQPNGYSFPGRHFLDEFGKYFATKDSYLFTFNEQDKYYYYMSIDNNGNLYRSQCKVGIDDPKSNGIRQHIFLSNEWRAKVAKARGWDKIFSKFSKKSPISTLSIPSPINLQVILVEFSDIKHRTNPAYKVRDFNNLLFLNGFNGLSPDQETVYGSMHDYYKDMSLNSFNLSGCVKNDSSNGYPVWIALPYTKEWYNTHPHETFFGHAKSCAIQQGINLIENETNKICIIYAGNMYTQELLPQEYGCYYDMSERYRIPTNPPEPRDREVSDATFSHIGVHCHEFGHIIGLADQYEPKDYWYGKWGLMCYGQHKGSNGVIGNNPASIEPYTRYKCGWISIHDVTQKMLGHQITYSSSMNGIHKVKGSQTEFFIIENRQVGSGWDQFLPGGGLLVW